ncbi:hypothetical protein ACFVT5_41460 [Streptomyces sp. NPDC058001]|uniref:hypothetical protein n=1 Tax=Streptomyces sp. NPDC058001 TaxID=3346300 RepID=UPI0036E35794
MPIGRVNAAKFIARHLPEPHETDLGGEKTHHRLAATHADIYCPPTGHHIGWQDCYDGANVLPLPLKADLFLEPDGQPRQLPGHLVGEQREQAEQTTQLAVWIRREANRRNLH